MIAQQPQREHCGFEDYCRHYCPASQGRDPCKGTVKQIFCEHDTRSRPHTPAPDNEKLIKVAKLRIRQLFLDDSKCELCEKVTEEDGYDGQNEGCEKGLCIECAIHKALVEFFDAIALAATLAAEQTDNILSVLKKRYKNEMAILDYVEMIECEVMALAKQADEQDFHPAQNDTKHHNKGQPVGNWQEQHP